MVGEQFVRRAEWAYSARIVDAFWRMIIVAALFAEFLWVLPGTMENKEPFIAAEHAQHLIGVSRAEQHASAKLGNYRKEGTLLLRVRDFARIPRIT